MQKWSERVTHAVQADTRNIDALRQVGAQDFPGGRGRGGLVDRGLGAHHRQPRRPEGAADLGEGGVAVARQDPRPRRREPRGLPRARGRRAGRAPRSGRMLDFIRFDDDFALAKMYPPKFIRGVPPNQSGVRRKVQRHRGRREEPGQAVHATPRPGTVVTNHDLIIVSGTNSDIERFATLDR